PELGEEPFWLAQRGFQATGESVGVGGKAFAGWARAFPPGEVGLGVNSFRGGGEHYFATLRPVNPADTLAVTDLYPGQLRLGALTNGAPPWADRDTALTNVPPALAGQTLHFDVTIRDVREATEDELNHGHAHGPGGAHH
ncbi:MAG TPA: hypothetical protein PKB10_00875, partial [Tepidisphaeraceae bacterium]|nr:hypothetical protein [Tepidisphaeraceae bacterium]